MAQDVWLLRRALAAFLLLSVLAGNVNGANKALSLAQLSLLDIKDHLNHTFSSAVKNKFVRKSSSEDEVELKTKQEKKDAAHNKPATIRRKHVRRKSKLSEDPITEKSTKRNVVSGNEETGVNITRMRALDSFFVHPEIMTEQPAKENISFGNKQKFLSALPLGHDGRLNDEMALQNSESELPMTQNLDRKVSTQFLDWHRKGLGNDKLVQEGFEMDGLSAAPVTLNMEKYGDNSVEGRRIVHAASLVENSLESQGTGLTDPVKYLVEKVGNRARAFQYFLPTQGALKVKPHSRYRYVNSLIKSQLAGILADLNELKVRKEHAKSRGLKNASKSGESKAKSKPGLREADTRIGLDAEFKTSKGTQEAKDVRQDNTDLRSIAHYNVDDTFLLGSSDRPTFLQEMFLSNPKAIQISSGSGDNNYGYGKFKSLSVKLLTLRWQKHKGKVASNQSIHQDKAVGKYEESGFEEFTHSGGGMSPDKTAEDFYAKPHTANQASSEASETLNASAQVSLQSSKAVSHIEEESYDLDDMYSEGSSEILAIGQDSSEARKMSPPLYHSYFRPTKVQGFPKATILPNYKRTTIPNPRYNSKFESWASSSGEGSSSGEIIMAPWEHSHKLKPTPRVSVGRSSSTARKTHTGIIRLKDKKTTRTCEKIGKSGYREKCPRGWLSFDKFCYLFVSHSMGGWEEFPQECKKENALLAMPRTVKELKFLQDKMRSSKHNMKYCYIGLKKKGGKWTWIDEVPYTRNVNVTYKFGTKTCGALSRSGRVQMVACNEPKAGYVCELRTGVTALSILAFGDSLTSGFHSEDKSHTPYAKTLEYLLNKDLHRCYTLTTVAKEGMEASEMSVLLQSYLKKTKFKYTWVIILAGTNDIVHNSHKRNRKAWDTLVEHILDLHITSHRLGGKTMAVTIPEMDCEESDKPPCQHTRLEREYINEKLRHYARTNDSTILCDLAIKLPRYSLSNEERNRMWEKSLHMKRAGYERMAEIIYQDLLPHIDDVEK